MKQKLITISVSVLADQDVDGNMVASAVYNGATSTIPNFARAPGTDPNIEVLESVLVSEFETERNSS
jgi:hypothetical protein